MLTRALVRPLPRPHKRSLGLLPAIVGLVGRAFVVCGAVMLLFTAYLQWGTSQEARRAQADLAAQLAEPLTKARPYDVGGPPAGTEPTVGRAAFALAIPKLGVRNVVVEGVDDDALRKGPGHFPDTPRPGEPGNVAIAGHRTTYGAPFYRLDELRSGDEILVTVGQDTHRYVTREQFVVSPDRVDVVAPHGRDELTLTTCHPRFSAARRLIVHADYAGTVQPPPAGQLRSSQVPGAPARPSQLAAASVPIGLPIPPDVFVLATLAGAAVLGAMLLSSSLRRLAVYASVVVLTSGLLWSVAFPHAVRLLPAQY